MWKRLPPPPTRPLGRRLLLASAALGLLAAVLSFVPDPSAQGAPFPLFLWEDSPVIANSIGSATILCAALFSVGLVLYARPQRGVDVGVTAGFVSATVGIVLFVETFTWGAYTFSTGGSLVHVQVYAQPAFLAAWGILTLVFVPLIDKAVRADRLRRFARVPFGAT